MDVSHDRVRAIVDASRPVLVPGRKAVVHIHLSGNEKLLRCRKRQFSMNPPRAAIANGEVKLFFEWPHDRKPAIEAATDALIADIERPTEWQRRDIERYNRELPDFARQAIAVRRQRVLDDREHLDG